MYLAEFTALITRVSLFGLPLDIGVTEQDVIQRMADGNLRLTYLNPLAYHIVKEFPDYASNLDKFDLVVCDGIGVQKAVESVYRRSTPIMTPDYYGIGRGYLAFGAQHRSTLCLVGGKPGVSATAAKTIDAEFPGYRGIASFDGYGNSLDQARAHVLDARPDLVLIGLGMGRQEAWLLRLAAGGWSGVGICVGGFLDKLANPGLSYPRWTERTKLRFLARLMQEPLRMSKRYFIDYQPFIRHYLRSLLSRTK